eukprot:13348872-Heterocapsa_arctica.AAC.1
MSASAEDRHILGLATFQQYRFSTFGFQRPSSRQFASAIGLATPNDGDSSNGSLKTQTNKTNHKTDH